jgi:hypothetical protein
MGTADRLPRETRAASGIDVLEDAGWLRDEFANAAPRKSTGGLFGADRRVSRRARTGGTMTALQIIEDVQVGCMQ